MEAVADGGNLALPPSVPAACIRRPTQARKTDLDRSFGFYGPVVLEDWLLKPTTAQSTFPLLSVPQAGPAEIGFVPTLPNEVHVDPSKVAAYIKESGMY